MHIAFELGLELGYALLRAGPVSAQVHKRRNVLLASPRRLDRLILPKNT